MAGFEANEQPLEPITFVKDEITASVLAQAVAITERPVDFEAVMGLVDEGLLSLDGAMDFCRAAANHHRSPSEFPAPEMLDFA
ncbi:hypothetical protein KDA14_00505 [Candidatus Saccharibacteria bacterium]|nr:hypothetical protein [Candidatus Saccharibacteria bacterium]